MVAILVLIIFPPQLASIRVFSFFVIFNYTILFRILDANILRVKNSQTHRYEIFNVRDEIKINIIGKMKFETREHLLTLKKYYSKYHVNVSSFFLFILFLRVEFSDCNLMHGNWRELYEKKLDQ